MSGMKRNKHLVSKVAKKMSIFTRTSKLHKLSRLLIILLICQSGFSYATQCNEYLSVVSSAPEQPMSISAYDDTARNVTANDTSNEETNCSYCVLCKCGHIKLLVLHLIHNEAKLLYTNHYDYFRNSSDTPVEGLLRPPKN